MVRESEEIWGLGPAGCGAGEGERARPVCCVSAACLDEAERTCQGVKCLTDSLALQPLNSPTEKGLSPFYGPGN